jgi:hypothetical protein
MTEGVIMKQIHKEYAQSFQLEPTKLTRILDKIHERLEEQAHATKRDHFEVFMSGSRREEMTNVEDVLKLENSRKHRIQRVLIACSATAEGSVRPEHEVQVDFCVTKTKVEGEAINVGKVVAISVRSDANGWASRTLSEVEEQVERTWLRQTPLLLVLGILTLGITLVLAFQFVTFERPFETIDFLDGTDIQRVEQMLDAGQTVTAEEAREVTTMQLRNVVLYNRPQQPKRTSRKLVLFGIPLVALLGLAITLFTQYPGAAFLWGDEIERHASRVQRRRILWGLILSLVVGVLAKLLLEGASSWIPKE